MGQRCIGEFKSFDQETKGESKMSSTETQGVAAVGFLVMAFLDETAADQALKAMQDAKKQKKFYFENAAVIRQDASGKVNYKETGDMKSGKGAGVGALIGGVIGILGGPAGVALGAGAGAAIGAAAAHGDAGFRDESLQTVGSALKPSTSAIAAITSDAFLRAFREQVSVDDVRATVRNLAAEISARLNEGNNVALGVLLAETGLAIKELAYNENSAQVIGMAITDDAVVAGAATMTADQVDYVVAGATKDGSVVEVGTATKDGALVVDDVVTDEGETVVATTYLPEDAAPDAPAGTGDTKDTAAKA
jgi:uncharacterized membrane protein